MNTPILVFINLGLIIVLAAVCGYLWYQLEKLRGIRKYFLEEHQPANLEEILGVMSNKIKVAEQHRSDIEQSITKIQNQLNFAIQKIGIVRFNSQPDEGGNLSFCIALLDAQYSGFIITSMHGRQQNRIYSKIVTKGSSETALSEEEQTALNQAIH